VLYAGGPVRVLAELSLAPGHRRGHGALYDAVNCGRVDVARLRWSLAALPLPGWADGRIRPAVDVSNWLRPDAGTSPQRQPLPSREPGQMGRPVRHGPEFKLAAGTHPGPDVITTTQTSRYGTAFAAAWHRLHPKLYARGAWVARCRRLAA
jgi:hypothetical protein